MAAKMSARDARAYVDELYRKVAKRWEERVTNSQFMKELTTGRLPKKTFRLFFKNWAAYTIEINRPGGFATAVATLKEPKLAEP